VRAAQRNGTDPNTKMNWLGFRCARDAKDAGDQAEAKPRQTG
jgi:iron(II)-dependent oxidoreductase